MRSACVFLAFLVLLLPLAAKAEPRFTGDYLLQMCAYDQKGNELAPGGHIACQAYIAGVLDYHNLIKSMGTAPSVDFCVPDSVGLYDVQKKVTSYIFKNRGEHTGFIASPAVALALYTGYPCKGKKK